VFQLVFPSPAMAEPDHPEGCKGVELFKKGSSLDEMVECLDENKVLFGIIKTGLDGAGSFSRKSTMFVCYKGDKLGQVKSSKIMAHKFAVQSFCESYAKLTSQINCYEKKNMKDLIIEEIKSTTIDDSKDMGDLSFNLGDTKGSRKELHSCPKFELDLAGKGYGMCICGAPRGDHSEEALAGAVEEENEPAGPGQKEGYRSDPPAPAPAPVPSPVEPDEASRSKVAELKRQASGGLDLTEYAKACQGGSPPSAEEVLDIVRDMRGVPYNWVLLKPSKDDLQVEDAGGGGVVQLSALLEKNHGDKLLYGLVRVAFGKGKLRRAWVFSVHWQGQNCSGVKVMMQKRECAAPMEEKMGDNSFTIDAIGPDDVMPEAVIAKLTSSVVVDGNSSDLSVQSLIDALEEEKEAIRLFNEEQEKKKTEAAAAAMRSETERLEAERQEKERLENMAKDEVERLENEKKRIAAEAAEAAAAAEAKKQSAHAVPRGLQEIGDGDDDGWVLFEIVT